MEKGRLEAFSDGVTAIILTIMVLELKVPREADLNALRPLAPVLTCYVLSFVNIGIYWNNHHHMLQAARHVNGAVLWANLHLLFWLSLTPFTTGWMGENQFAPVPVFVYGIVLLMCSIAYYLLARTLSALHGTDSALTRALGRDVKGKISTAIYALGVELALYNRWLALGLYVIVALMWLVPDRRMELAPGPEL